MNRRTTLALAALLPAAVLAEPDPGMENATMFDDIFKASMESKKGLTFYVKGQTVGGLVTKIGNGFVEVRNQTHSRVVIRIDSIDAAALS